MLLEALTPNEIAVRLGVERPVVSQLIRAGVLPVAAVNVDGEPLIFDHHLELHGDALRLGRPEDLRSPRLRRLWRNRHRVRVLPCGCAPSLETGEPAILCCDARALQSAERLAAAFAVAAPDDPFFRRLATVTREAFERHIGAGSVEAAQTEKAA